MTKQIDQERLLESFYCRRDEVKAHIASLDPDKHIFNTGIAQARLAEIEKSIKEIESGAFDVDDEEDTIHKNVEWMVRTEYE